MPTPTKISQFAEAAAIFHARNAEGDDIYMMSHSERRTLFAEAAGLAGKRLLGIRKQHGRNSGTVDDRTAAMRRRLQKKVAAREAAKEAAKEQA